MEEVSMFDETGEHRYFIKRLGAQEMGSREQREDRANRGRYLLVPNECVNFFPPHDEKVLNDHAYIGITPVFHRGETENSLLHRSYLEYVYHNSKWAENRSNGRNEHRIYLSKKLDGGCMYQGDILIFRRKSPKELADFGLIRDDVVSPNDIWDFYLDWIRPDDSPAEWAIYSRVLDALATGRRNSNSVVASTPLDMFEAKVAAASLLGLRTDIDERIIRTCRRLDESFDDTRFNEQSFRDFVLWAYDYDCCVSHESVVWGNQGNLEVVRIKPLAEGGRLVPSNGIPLRSDLAWAFRCGMITLEPGTHVVRVHEAVSQSYLGRFDGVKVVPSSLEFAPHDYFVRHHREHVFGRFFFRKP